jgi:hypothetical protein
MRSGAGVHQMQRDLHHDVEHARANSTGGFRGDDDDARRLTASRGRGGAPTKSSRRRGARGCKHTTRAGSLLCGGSKAQLQGDGPATKRRGTGGTGAAGSRRQPTRVRWQRVLGFGEKSWGGAVEAAHLNRRAGESLACRPGKRRRAAAGLGLDPESESGRRREEAADERALRVSDRGRPRRELRRARETGPAGPLAHGLKSRVGLKRRKGEWREEGNLFTISKVTQTNEFK